MPKKRYSHYKKGPQKTQEENHEIFEKQRDQNRKVRLVTQKPVADKSILNTSYSGLLGLVHRPDEETVARWKYQAEQKAEEKRKQEDEFRKDQAEKKAKYEYQNSEEGKAEQAREEEEKRKEQERIAREEARKKRIQYLQTSNAIQKQLEQEVAPSIQKAVASVEKSLNNPNSYHATESAFDNGHHQYGITERNNLTKSFVDFQNYLLDKNIKNSKPIVTKELDSVFPSNSYYVTDKYGHRYGKYWGFSNINPFDHNEVSDAYNNIVNKLIANGSSRESAINAANKLVFETYKNDVESLIKEKGENGALYNISKNALGTDQWEYLVSDDVTGTEKKYINTTYDYVDEQKPYYEYKKDSEGNDVIVTKYKNTGKKIKVPVEHYEVSNITRGKKNPSDYLDFDDLYNKQSRQSGDPEYVTNLMNTPELTKLKSAYNTTDNETALRLNRYIRAQIFKDNFNKQNRFDGQESSNWFNGILDNMTDDQIERYIPQNQKIKSGNRNYNEIRNSLKTIAMNEQQDDLMQAQTGIPRRNIYGTTIVREQTPVEKITSGLYGFAMSPIERSNAGLYVAEDGNTYRYKNDLLIKPGVLGYRNNNISLGTQIQNVENPILKRIPYNPEYGHYVQRSFSPFVNVRKNIGPVSVSAGTYFYDDGEKIAISPNFDIDYSKTTPKYGVNINGSFGYDPTQNKIGPSFNLSYNKKFQNGGSNIVYLGASEQQPKGLFYKLWNKANQNDPNKQLYSRYYYGTQNDLDNFNSFKQRRSNNTLSNINVSFVDDLQQGKIHPAIAEGKQYENKDRIKLKRKNDELQKQTITNTNQDVLDNDQSLNIYPADVETKGQRRRYERELRKNTKQNEKILDYINNYQYTPQSVWDRYDSDYARSVGMEDGYHTSTTSSNPEWNYFNSTPINKSYVDYPEVGDDASIYNQVNQTKQLAKQRLVNDWIDPDNSYGWWNGNRMYDRGVQLRRFQEAGQSNQLSTIKD